VSVLLVADAGPRAGLGHVVRTGAVAAALQARGVRTRCLAWGAEEPSALDGVEWQPLPREAAPPAGGTVVMDSYDASPDALEELADRGRLVAMHDRGPAPARAGIVVSAGRDEAASTGPGELFGPRYACLRPAFWGLPAREVRGEVRRVLVATGGADAGGAGPRLAAAAKETLPDAEVALVRGPYATEPAPAGVVAVERPATLLDELLAADVVLTAGGQALLEAVAAGTPAIAAVLAENQREQVDRAAAAGAAVSLEADADAAAVLAALAADQQRRAALARRGQELVDGYGALRVAFHVAALERDGEAR
jgi:spore coat polysaccharide biosynthesis predicted glycosyltransferase SpsG